MTLLANLDTYGTDDPDFNEGHYEDRCPVCEKPVVDHPCWRHRLYALMGIVAGRVLGFIKDTA